MLLHIIQILENFFLKNINGWSVNDFANNLKLN